MGSTRDWRTKYSRRIALVDAAVIGWAVVGAYIIRFGFDSEPASRGNDFLYLWGSGTLGFVWWLMLGAWNSRKTRILGAGAEEYKRIAAASLWLFGLVAIVSYVARYDTARGYVGVALPAGLLGLLLARWLMRQHLSVDRQAGKSVSRVLLVGGPGAVAHLATNLAATKQAGYLPVAAYTPGASELTQHLPWDLPVLGNEAAVEPIMAAIVDCRADAVAVSAGVQLHPQTLRHLGWALAAQNVDLIMAPALTDVAGPRIHTQQVAGLPLIHVTTPTLEGGQGVAKRLFDIAVSALCLLLLSPLMVCVAILIKFDGGGPVFFVQERVGLEGKSFNMIKFRSMVVDAEERLSELTSDGNGVLFKLKQDPRVTRVGNLLRRLSIDELPQLFNIFIGSMSLVGPRPPLPREVEGYEHDVRRRLLVKPGLTGLWQVSGRSNLSWQDSVRLDLYYVENWSLAGDLVILLRTVRAVIGRHGAY